MLTNVTYAMSPSHPRWDEFLERLCGPEGCDFKAKGWTCFGDGSGFPGHGAGGDCSKGAATVEWYHA